VRDAEVVNMRAFAAIVLVCAVSVIPLSTPRANVYAVPFLHWYKLVKS
jgi:hypothetical protein